MEQNSCPNMMNVYLSRNCQHYVFVYPAIFFSNIEKIEKFSIYQKYEQNCGRVVIHNTCQNLFYEFFDYLENLVFSPELQRKVKIYIPLFKLFTKKPIGFFLETYTVNAFCGLKYHESLDEDYYFHLENSKYYMNYSLFVKRIFEQLTNYPDREIVFRMFFNIPKPSNHPLLNFLSERKCFVKIQKPSVIKINNHHISRLRR